MVQIKSIEQKKSKSDVSRSYSTIQDEASIEPAKKNQNVLERTLKLAMSVMNMTMKMMMN
jgi:hypothetical protein